MFASMHNPASAYSQVGLNTSVQGADPHRLVLMLFEGAEVACRKAKVSMANGEISEKAAAIKKALDIIICGLAASLDIEHGGDIAEKLDALYDYMAERLVWANLKNDTQALDEVSALLAELREAWASIDPYAQPIENP
jgi:flagellar secretion chaperone FliS